MNRRSSPKNLGATLKRLADYLGFYRILLVVAFVLIVVRTLGMVYGNYMLKPIMNSLVAGEGVAQLAKHLSGVVIGYILAVISMYIAGRLFMYIAQKTTGKIRKDVFEHLQTLPVSFFDKRQHGDLMSAMTNDIDNISMALGQSLSNVISSIFMFTGVVIMLFVLSPTLALLVMVLLFLMLLSVRFVGSLSAKAFRARQTSLAGLNGFIEEYMSGQKVIKVYNHEKHVIDDFNEVNEQLRDHSVKGDTYSTLMFPLTGNLTHILFSIVAIVGSVLTITGNIGLDIGTLASFLQFTRNIARPITNLATQFNMVVAAIAGAERVFEILDADSETDAGKIKTVVDEEGDGEKFWYIPDEMFSCEAIRERTGNLREECQPSDALVEKNPGCYVPVRGDLRFVDVSFSYDKSDDKILKDISFYAKPGQRLAFVGSTGAGKTTIINLINRFYEIDSGHIYFDGIDIREIDKAELRNQLGIVLQDVRLFEDTIRENIRYGKLDASDEDVIKAAKAANAHQFIMNLNDGYDTMLTTDGQNLSQGQRQLISIARAALDDPPILILDEATSSVDTRTEALIGKGMDKIMQDRTVFAIAHRLSTVRGSNAIIVLEHGEVIERGIHEQLMELKGRYYEFNTGKVELE
ncbi:MAG: ABC transporter ATP-binding protein [Clostridiaceae bacterium]|nr:ABC transporter ATP-binding protein [Clostridiaceae bacterium]